MDTYNNVSNSVAPVVEQPKENHLPYVLIFLALIIVLIVPFLFIFLKDKINRPAPQSNSTKVSVSTPTPIVVHKKKGGLSLNVSGGSIKKTVGSDFTVDVVLDSPQAQITSFDMIFKFDKNKLEMINSQTTLAGFSLVSIEDTEGIVITAFKSPSSTVLHNLDQVSLLNLGFRAKEKGKTIMAVVKEKDKRTTKFVDGTSRVFYPEVDNIEIEIN